MLQTQDLKVALDAEVGLVKAIDGLTLAIRRGETFALVGESGCGKSTLARMVTMIEQPTEGSLRIDGTEVTTADAATLLDSIRRVASRI